METHVVKERNLFAEMSKFQGEATPFERPLFGRMLRLLRAYTDESAMQMAGRVAGSNSAYLSALERGRKIPTRDFIESVASSYRLTESEVNALFMAADERRPFFKIKVGSAEGSAEVAYELSRKFAELDSETLAKLKEVILSP